MRCDEQWIGVFTAVAERERKLTTKDTKTTKRYMGSLAECSVSVVLVLLVFLVVIFSAMKASALLPPDDGICDNVTQ